MSTNNYVVTQVTGQAWIRHGDGSLQSIVPGMRIPEGVDIVTSSDGQVSLQAEGQPQLLIIGEQDRPFEAIEQEVFGSKGDAAETTVAVSDPAQAVLAALDEGEDPFAEVDPTEALVSGDAGAGSTFVRLQNVLEVTTPLDLAYPKSAPVLDTVRRVGGLEDPGGPVLHSDAVVMNEDGTGNYANVNGKATGLTPDGMVIGSVLLNDVSARGFNLHITSFNVNGTNYAANGDEIAIKGETGLVIGYFSLASNGEFSFKPAENYSGGIPTIGYTAQEATTGQTASAFLNIKIIPVADAPIFDVNGVQIFEDGVADVHQANATPKYAEIQLQLPKLVDIIDLNGPNTAGDDPERAGFITLKVECDGIDANHTAEMSFGGQNYTLSQSVQEFAIIIVDSNGNPIDHITGVFEAAQASGLPVLILTQAQYESFVLKPAADSGANINFTISATSYEVDAAGRPLPGIDGATTSKDATVDVHAVTDAVRLNWANDIGADAARENLTVKISEDHYLNLKGLLESEYKDLDGSEERNICIINNNKEGISIWVNGAELKYGEKLIIVAEGLSRSTSAEDYPDIKIGLLPGVTGTVTGIEVQLWAKDQDFDSNANIREETDSVYLNLNVTPAADVVITGRGEIFEDIPGQMIGSIAGQEVGGDREVSYFSIKDIPEGWMIFDKDGNQIYPSADGDDSGTLVLLNAPKNWADFESYIKEFQVQAGEQSSRDGVLKVDYTITHPSPSNPNIKQEASGEFDLSVKVRPIAEKVGDGSGEDGLNHGLSMTEGHTYQTATLEDEWFALNVANFNLKSGWNNPDQDGSEKTYAALKPMWLEPGTASEAFKSDVDAQNDAMARAAGAKISWIDGDGNTHVYIFDGVNPIRVPMEFLESVEFLAPAHAAGEFAIKVQAYTVDTDVDSSEVNTATSGEAWLDGIKFNPVAEELDDSAVQVGGGNGNEDTFIAIRVNAYSVDPAEGYNIKIEDIPQNATIKYAGVEININSNMPGFDIVKTASGWTLVINDYERTEGLSIKPPHNSNDDFTLKVSAQTVDTANGVTSISNWTNPKDLPVTVRGVADWVEAEIDKGSYVEANLDKSASTFKLTDMVKSVQLHDNDGSETMSFKITGVPEGFKILGAYVLDAGTGTERTWFVRNADELSLVKIVTPDHYSGSLNFKLIGITSENDGDWSEGVRDGVNVVVQEDVHVEITPSPESEGIDKSIGLEDALRPVNFGISNNFGDGNETMDAVYIKIDDVEDKAFSLYLDGKLLSESGVEIEDGYYKLTGDQMSKVEGRANVDHWAHKPGETGFQFGVKYDITDPSNDGTLDPVTKQIEDTYTFKITAVTDQLTAGDVSVNNVSVNDGSFHVDGSEVQVRGIGDFSVQFNIATPDGDGSEQLVQFVIEGIPDGMTVAGVTGGSGAQAGSVYFLGDGKWLLNVPASSISGGQADVAVTFHAGERLNYQDGQEIKITAVSVDPGASSSSNATVSWTLVNPGSSAPVPADVFDVTWTPNDDFKGREDTSFNLSEAYDVGLEITAGYEQSVQFSLQLKLPEGCTVTYKGTPLVATPVGGIQGEAGGQEVWLVTGKGGEEEMRQMLQDIKITPPPNFNDNFGDGFKLDAKMTVFHEETGSQHQETMTDKIPLEPVTDAGGIDVTLVNADTGGTPVEGSPVDIHVRVSSGVDGGVTLGDSVYLQLDASYKLGGTLTYNGQVLSTQTVSAGNSLGLEPGEYYVIPTGLQTLPIGGATDYKLTYTPNFDELYTKGSVTVEAWVSRQEIQAQQTVTVKDGEHVDIPGISNGYDFELPSTIVVAENQGGGGRIQLQIDGEGLRDKADGSEEVYFAILKNLPNGFLVYVGEDAAHAQLAGNAGGNIYGGRVWNIPLTEDGDLPAYIAIQVPKNWSGTIPDLEMVVISTEIGADSAIDTRVFDLDVKAVADGVIIGTENKVLGSEGNVIDLNLSITMKDPGEVKLGGGSASLFPDSSTETATLEFTGIGAHAAFYVGSELLAWNGVDRGFSYDPLTGKYLVYGLSQSDIFDLGILQTRNDLNADLDFRIWTTESENGSMSEISSGVLDLTIHEQSSTGTDGNDTYLFDGESLFDGGSGEDTVYLRFGEDLDFDKGVADKFSNIEVLDLTREGFNHEVSNLSASDVLKMTDDDNILTILLDEGDRLTFKTSDTWVLNTDKSSDSFSVYTTTVDGSDVEVKISTGSGGLVGINGQDPVAFRTESFDDGDVEMMQRMAQQLVDDGKNALDGTGL